MEASPNLSTIDEATDHGDREETPEPYTHYLDRIASKEGHRTGVYWTSGDHYIGEWHLNLRHDRGTHTYRNGSIYEGEWENFHVAVSGAYSRNTGEDQVPIPFAWFPSVQALSQKCLKLAASRVPPARFDIT